ncbi:hypothetical protein D3C87_1955620 [compost metagenome]
MPALVRLPAPLIAPVNISSRLPWTVRLPELATALFRAIERLLSSAALPVTFSAPLLNAWSLSRRSVPPFNTVSPR